MRALVVPWLVVALLPDPIRDSNATVPRHRAECVIYIAAEPKGFGFSKENTAAIIKWLRFPSPDIAKDDAHVLGRVADRVEDDAKVFPAAVVVDVWGLESALSAVAASGKQGRDAEPPVRAFVFSTQLVHENGYLEFKDGGFTKKVEEPWTLSGEPLRTENPFSSPELVREALRRVVKQAPPEQFDYVLVMKGHGEAGQFMRPFVATDGINVTDDGQAIRQQVLQKKKDGEYQLKTIGDRAAGITKPEFLEILKQMGEEERVTFSLVLVDACSTSYAESDRPGCVEKLCFSPHSTPYVGVNYSDLEAPIARGEIFSTVLSEKAVERNFTVLPAASTASTNSQSAPRAERSRSEQLLLNLPLVIGAFALGYWFRGPERRVSGSSIP